MPFAAFAIARFCSSDRGFTGGTDSPLFAAAFCILSSRLFMKSSPAWLGTVDLSSTLAKRAGAFVSAQVTDPLTVPPTTKGDCCAKICPGIDETNASARMTIGRHAYFKVASWKDNRKPTNLLPRED